MYIESTLDTNIVTQSNFTSNIFSANAANAAAFGGEGALYLDGGETILDSNVFAHNAASQFGGALPYSYQCLPSGMPFHQLHDTKQTHGGKQRYVCLYL